MISICTVSNVNTPVTSSISLLANSWAKGFYQLDGLVFLPFLPFWVQKPYGIVMIDPDASQTLRCCQGNREQLFFKIFFISKWHGIMPILATLWPDSGLSIVHYHIYSDQVVPCAEVLSSGHWPGAGVRPVALCFMSSPLSLILFPVISLSWPISKALKDLKST